MVKTSAERYRTYAEKHKDDPAFREKLKEKQKKYRQANVEKTNASAAERMRRKRARDKMAKAMLTTAESAAAADQSPYSTKQAEGKAWKKVKDSLPVAKEKRIHM